MTFFASWNARGMMGLYDTDIHGDRIPEDAVEITPARRTELLEAVSSGKVVTRGPGGSPRIARSTRSLASRQDLAAAAIRSEASRRINAISPPWRQLNDARDPTPEGDARFAAIDAVRAASNAIE